MAVFSDSRVQVALEDFVAVVQNCAYTQNHDKDDAHSRFFRKIIQRADEMNARRGITDFSFAGISKRGFSTQGLYTFSSDGTAYGGMNQQDPQAVLKLLAHAKKSYRENPPDTKFVLGKFPKVKPQPPRGTIIARTFSRIGPLTEGMNPRNNYVGRDHMWILPEEVDALLSGDFPEPLYGRIVRFQLRDNVRGQPDVWQDKHIFRADFSAKVTPGEKLTTVELSGEFLLSAPKGRGYTPQGYPLPETGYEGSIEGLLVYDDALGKVTDFQMLAEGMHWGRSMHNPDEPPGKYPLKIAFVLADDEAARNTPPSGAAWGKWYTASR